MAWDVLTEEQREVRDLVRALARERVAPRAAEIDRSHEFPWDIVELFREHDLFRLFFDERWGGSGSGTLLALVAIEEISKACATSGLILAGQGLGSLSLQLAGSEAQKERYLPRLATGEWLCAYALTEAGSGSDAAAMRTTARRDGDGFVLDGTKRFITNAGVASCTPCSRRPIRARATRASRRSSSRRTRPASRWRATSPRWASAARRPGELVFDGMRLPLDSLLGDEGTGFKLAMRILDRSRPGVAAQGLGIAQGATDFALEYAKTRETMGKPIAQHQLIAAKLADMETRCELARGVLYKFGQMADAGVDGKDLTKISAIAKLACTDAAMWVTTEAVQILGGYGYIEEYPVERMLRDAKITQIYEGTNEIQRLVIAREMLREQRNT